MRSAMHAASQLPMMMMVPQYSVYSLNHPTLGHTAAMFARIFYQKQVINVKIIF